MITYRGLQFTFDVFRADIDLFQIVQIQKRRPVENLEYKSFPVDRDKIPYQTVGKVVHNIGMPACHSNYEVAGIDNPQRGSIKRYVGVAGEIWHTQQDKQGIIFNFDTGVLILVQRVGKHGLGYI